MANTRFPRIKTDPAQYTKQEFSKTWESSEDFPTVELSEAQVRKDMQCLHDEMKAYVNGALIDDVAASFDAVADELDTYITSVNGKTRDEDGAITLTPEDIGAMPIDSFGNIGVATINGKSGQVTLTKDDIGLGQVDNVRQYSASNPPPYPVASVCGKVGAVTLTAEDVAARPSTWTPSKSNIGLGLVANERQYSANNPPPYPVTSVNGMRGDVAIPAGLRVGEIYLDLSWVDHDTYYTQIVDVEDAPANAKFDLQPDVYAINQLISDGVTSLYIENDDGFLTAYATGAAPTEELTIQCTITEVSA